jgi:hypothetical protein
LIQQQARRTKTHGKRKQQQQLQKESIIMTREIAKESIITKQRKRQNK